MKKIISNPVYQSFQPSGDFLNRIESPLTDWLDYIETRWGYSGETAIAMLSFLRAGGQHNA